MAEATKYQLVPNTNIVTDFRSHFSLFRNRKSTAFVYGVVFVFIAFSVFLAFSPTSSSTSSSSWFINIFTLNNTSPPNLNDDSFRSPVFDSNSTQISDDNSHRSQNTDTFQTPMSDFSQNLTQSQLPPDKVDDSTKTNSPEKLTPQISPLSSSKDSNFENNSTDLVSTSDKSGAISAQVSPISSDKDAHFESNDSDFVTPKNPSNKSSETSAQVSPQITPISPNKEQQINQSISQNTPPNKAENFNPNNATNHSQKQSNQSIEIPPKISKIPENSTKSGNGVEEKAEKKSNTVSDSATSLPKISKNGTNSGETKKQGNDKKSLVDSLVGCDLYDGDWVMDDSYPLYKPGSCKIVDEQFNCILNGRPDTDFQKLRWKPKGCTLPRLKGRQILKLLKGKNLVFVGDSLNRNMWESLVCILKAAVKNPKNVFEASGKHSFRTEASYSFVFKDYDFTIKFFVAPFLVQQWEVKETNGETKETLRLDLMVRDSDHFKNADVVVFNTGHWWTHEKTSKGEDYYQEGSHIYQQLDVQEAFRKAITTWGRWVDANINPQKTHVFFRGYSSTHFRGGQWNSGGQCDSETEPIRNETYLTKYPWKMKVLENVLKGMKTPVSYLNITKLTDYRKDAHPSVYRKQRLSTEEKRTPLKFQDCSHWCLPGVPDSWNELLFAEMLRKHFLDNQTR